jgi:endo-1,4-beta-xylanase
VRENALRSGLLTRSGNGTRDPFRRLTKPATVAVVIADYCCSKHLSLLVRGLGACLPALFVACGGGDGGARDFALDTSNAPPPEEASLTCPGDGELPVIEVGNLSLAEAYRDHFRVGVAVGGRTFGGNDPASAQLVDQQYNRVTPENAFKWQSIQNAEAAFNFGQAERFLQFAQSIGMEEVHGHTIVWHQQVPAWVFQAPAGAAMTRELLLARLDAHMSVLAERLGGRVNYWDVVNEAFNDDGSMRSSQWRNIIGDDYLEQAFAMADRYFPNAKLVYNDYSMERPGKRQAVVRMVQDFQAKGIRIDAIGNQAHYRIDGPSIEQIEATLDIFGALGVEVLITELDVDVLPSSNGGANSPALNPYVDCLPLSIEELAAERWSSLFEAFVRHSDVIASVTLWGVSDGYSWLNNTPVNGRTNYALLFDRQLRPKLSWQRVIEAANSTP